MSNYKVRSRDLVDLVNEIRAGTLILSPFFQRKLVWREAHKVDFIKTILLGYPFPEIFVSRGTLDVATMKSTSCIVDGQQRMNTIKEFLDGGLVVDGNSYPDLEKDQKESFLRYEVAIIDLDLAQEDPKIVEIFKRLNRTFYALSSIEKMSSEFGSSEFMLVAKMLAGELREEDDEFNVTPDLHKRNPNVSKDFVAWANQQDIEAIREFLVETPLFSKYEVSRQVHLMYTLNLMATLMVGLYARNEQVLPQLNLYAEGLPVRDVLIGRLNKAAKRFKQIKLPQNGPWYGKSNSFSLLVALDEVDNAVVGSPGTVRKRLQKFVEDLPDDYSLAAKEAVNNRKERNLRHKYIVGLLKDEAPDIT
ncbi:MAG: DUF262 domain-containing protein [Hyphomicrobiales bacterium]|nr:MAG: DUF262 domain-containing protein [Hyphomicrobiales bacterium]